MFGPDAGQAGERSFAIQPLATAKQNRSQSAGPGVSFVWGTSSMEGPHTFVPASAAYPNRTSTSVERPRRSTSSNFTEFSPKTLLKAFDPQVWPLRECFGLQRKWWLHENWQQYGCGARLGEFSGS